MGILKARRLGVYEHVDEKCRRLVFRIFARQSRFRQQRTRAQIVPRSPRKPPILIISEPNRNGLLFLRRSRPNLFHRRLQWNMTKGGITEDVLEARMELIDMTPFY